MLEARVWRANSAADGGHTSSSDSSINRMHVRRDIMLARMQSLLPNRFLNSCRKKGSLLQLVPATDWRQW